MVDLVYPELAMPKNYVLNRDKPELDPGEKYVKKRAKLFASLDTVSTPIRLLFNLVEVVTTNPPVVQPTHLGSILAIKENVELTIELDDKFAWHWDRDDSGPLTSKNEDGHLFFGGVQPRTSATTDTDREVVFFIKYNRAQEGVASGVEFQLNFHVVFQQSNSGKLKVMIDPSVVNPPPVGGFLPENRFSFFAPLFESIGE